MPDKEQSKKPEKKRRRRKTSGATKGLISNMAENGVNKGTKGFSGTINVSNPPVSTPFPSFGFPSATGPSIGTYYTGSSMQSQPQPQTQIVDSSKIDFIIAKLAKLDSIEAQQTSIISRLANIETAVSDNAKKIESMNSKMIQIEKSQEFVSGNYDTVKKSIDVNKKSIETHIRDISKLQLEVNSLQKENNELKESKAQLEDDVIDLKCRSMRDNFVFMGIPEVSLTPHGNIATGYGTNVMGSGITHNNDKAHGQMDTTPGSQMGSIGNGGQAGETLSYKDALTTEACTNKIYRFCFEQLHIMDPVDKIRIDRAHRMGAFTPGKTRNIVVKFKDTESKMVVKNALKNGNLKETPFAVFEQFPPVVQARRKALISEMIKARQANKKANLVRDKLYINNKLLVPTENGSGQQGAGNSGESSGSSA